MGTGPFAVSTFEALRSKGHSIAAVFTRPMVSEPGSRRPPPSPVRNWATLHPLPIEDPESANSEQTIDKLRHYEADLLVVCDYGQILKRPVLASTRLGGINLHGSLLPAYRGAAPVQWAMWSGEHRTGVSVIHMTPKLDGGPILSTRETEISQQETAGQLEIRLSLLGVEAVEESLERLLQWDGESAVGSPQDESQASTARRLSKADGAIDWSQAAAKIDFQIRAMQPWPGAFCECQVTGRQATRLVIRGATPLQMPTSAMPGVVIEASHELLVATGDGVLRIDRVQAAGKREMTTAEYCRGNPIPPGSHMQPATTDTRTS